MSKCKAVLDSRRIEEIRVITKKDAGEPKVVSPKPKDRAS